MRHLTRYKLFENIQIENSEDFPEVEKIKEIFQDLTDWVYLNLEDVIVEIHTDINRITDFGGYVTLQNDEYNGKNIHDYTYYKTYLIYVKGTKRAGINDTGTINRYIINLEYHKLLDAAIKRLKNYGFEIDKRKGGNAIYIIDKNDPIII